MEAEEAEKVVVLSRRQGLEKMLDMQKQLYEDCVCEREWSLKHNKVSEQEHSKMKRAEEEMLRHIEAMTAILNMR